MITAGDQTPMVAWSTIKVPLAVASSVRAVSPHPQTRRSSSPDNSAAESLGLSIDLIPMPRPR